MLTPNWSPEHDADVVTRLDHAVLDGIQFLTERRMLIGSVGNVSARSGSTIRITPTRMPYRAIGSDELVTVGLEGSIVEPDRTPSRELPMHLAIYRARPEVGAIVHTHSPHCTAWSFLGEDLEPSTEDSSYYGIGEVRTAAWAAPGSPELARGVRDVLGSSQAVLIGRHGCVAVADTVDLASTRAEIVERQAQIAWLLRSHHGRSAHNFHSASGMRS